MAKNRAHREGSLEWRFLGGNNNDQVGANSGAAVYHYKNRNGRKEKQALLFDIGVMGGDKKLENRDLAACDVLMPDITPYLSNPRDSKHKPEIKAEALFLSHSHVDHIEGIPYLIMLGYKLPPVYATPFTSRKLQQMLSNHEIAPEDWPEIVEMAPGQKIKNGRFNVTCFSVSHSTPQSVGFFVETPAGNMMHSADFKLDQTVLGGDTFSEEQFMRLAEQGVDLMLIDSTGSDREGEPVREADVRVALRQLMEENPDKRFVIAAMGGFEEGLASIAKVTAEFGRKLWLAGWSHEQSKAALEDTGLSLGRITGHHDLDIRSAKKGAHMQGPESVLVVTGTQGESNAVLTNIAYGNSSTVRLNKEKDIILFCAPSIPGRDGGKEKLVATLRKKGFEVITTREKTLYSPGHGRLSEILELARMADSRFYAPIHGDNGLLEKNKAELEGQGHKVLSARNGDSIRVDAKGVRLERKPNGDSRWVGFKTLTGSHWKERYYLTVWHPDAAKGGKACKKRGNHTSRKNGGRILRPVC